MRASFYGAYLGPLSRLRRGLNRAGRLLLFRRRRATYYHQPDDPYGHLWLQLLPRLIDRYPIDLRFVVVPVPSADVDPEPELRAAFATADARDLSNYYELDFPETNHEISASRLRRAEAVLLVDRPIAEQLRVARTVSEALFGGDGALLRRIVADEGSAQGQSLRPRLEQAYEELRAAGHYRGGVLRYGGEWYGNVDRLARLEARLAAEGLDASDSILKRRATPTFDQLPTPLPDGRFVLEVFHSFGSPFAYLATSQVQELMQRYPLDVRIRPVIPLRTKGVRPARIKLVQLVKDAKREAERLGLPLGRFARPGFAGLRRCAAVLRFAGEQGRAIEFANAAGRAIWSEAVDVATDEGLRRVVEASGLEWEGARTSLDRDDLDAVLEENRLAQRELGLWGFPVFKLGGYHTWGQDRLPFIEARLEAAVKSADAER